MICRQCRQNISPDCVLIDDFKKDEKEVLKNAICVFCYYGIDSWDSNGQLVTRYEAIHHTICHNCGRTLPNVDFKLKNGCRWCVQKKGKNK